MNELVEKIARAVLYEGYMLYPYRTSALKNRQRWNFGVLFPEAHPAVRSGAERSSMQTECLVTGGPEARIEATIRFLHLASITREGDPEPLQSASERELSAPEMRLSSLGLGTGTVPLELTATEDSTLRQEALTGALELKAVCLEESLFKLTVSVRNMTALPREDLDRDAALMRCFISTHLVLRVEGGEFVSLMNPPESYRQAAQECRNTGTWPVLVGASGERNCLLCSPIILYDYPEIAPESAGDLFDGTEIDELLTLRILTLTDEEKQQVRDGEPRAREILERSEAMPAEHFMKLHGALRSLRPQKSEKA